jgi:hypothetical protein
VCSPKGWIVCIRQFEDVAAQHARIAAKRLAHA